jgi:hypothetical protein
MNTFKKTGLVMILLLLPVFLYLLVSIPSKPVANVPDEFHYLVEELSIKSLAKKETILFLDSTISMEKLIWYNQFFDKYACFQIGGSYESSQFSYDEVFLNGQSFVTFGSSSIEKLNVSLAQFGNKFNAILIDEHAFLRGLYDLSDPEEMERLKMELFILISNQSECRKKF